jgi:hypothetical protein
MAAGPGGACRGKRALNRPKRIGFCARLSKAIGAWRPQLAGVSGAVEVARGQAPEKRDSTVALHPDDMLGNIRPVPFCSVLSQWEMPLLAEQVGG